MITIGDGFTNMRSELTRKIGELQRAAYQGPVRQVVGYLGLEPFLSKLYLSALITLSRKQYTVSINDATANYHARRPPEMARLQLFSSEERTASDIISNLRHDDVFYDIGSSIGSYTCLAANVIDDGTVVAFEPVPANTRTIRENLKLNNSDATVFTIALGANDDEVKLAIRSSTWYPDMSKSDSGAMANMLPSFTESEDTTETIRIDMRSGDSLIEAGEVPPPTVVKIDVDGAEYKVIEGLEKHLGKESCRLVYCEVHPEFLEENGVTAEDVESKLENLGFSLSRIHDWHGETSTSTPTYQIKCKGP